MDKTSAFVVFAKMVDDKIGGKFFDRCGSGEGAKVDERDGAVKVVSGEEFPGLLGGADSVTQAQTRLACPGNKAFDGQGQLGLGSKVGVMESDEEVDIAEKREFLAAVAADGEEGEVIAQGRGQGLGPECAEPVVRKVAKRLCCL